MENKVRINLSNLKGNLEVFEQKDLDELINVPDNEEAILEECKKYDFIEYPIELRQVTDNGQKIWIAEHPDLPGCITHGNTKEESLENLEDAKKGWIYDCIVDGRTVPAPKELENFSGRFVVRLPRELHYKITKMAELNDVSLNQQIIYMLSKVLGGERTNEVLEKILDKLDDIQIEMAHDTNRPHYDNYERHLERYGYMDKTVKHVPDFPKWEDCEGCYVKKRVGSAPGPLLFQI